MKDALRNPVDELIKGTMLCQFILCNGYPLCGSVLPVLV